MPRPAPLCKGSWRRRRLRGCTLPGKRLPAVDSFLFVPEKETKRARRSDAAAAGRGCGPGPQDAATYRRPTQVLGDLSKEND